MEAELRVPPQLPQKSNCELLGGPVQKGKRSRTGGGRLGSCPKLGSLCGC